MSRCSAAGCWQASRPRNLAQGAVPFAAAAVGAGLVSAVGFPYFTRFVPDGQAGRYAGAFFSGARDRLDRRAARRRRC